MSWQPNDGPFTLEEFGSDGHGHLWTGSRVYPINIPLRLPPFNIKYPDKVLNIVTTAGIAVLLLSVIQTKPLTACIAAWIVMAVYELALHKYPSRWDLLANLVGAIAVFLWRH